MNKKFGFIKGIWQKIIVAAVLLMATGGLATAGSLVEAPTPPCIWTATYEYKKEPVPPQNSNDPRELRAFKRMQLIFPRAKLKTTYAIPDVRRVLVQWVMGRTTEHWTLSKGIVYSSPALPDGEISYARIPDDADPDTSPLNFRSSTLNFPELGWLKPEYFTGKTSYQGVSARHYTNPPSGKAATDPSGSNETQPADNAPGNANSARVKKQEAWIDSKTGFPLAMEDENVRITYKLLKDTPSSSDMKMPPAYEAVWNRIKTNL